MFTSQTDVTKLNEAPTSDIELANIQEQLKNLENDGFVVRDGALVEKPGPHKTATLFTHSKKTEPLETCGQWIKRKLGCIS